MTDHHDPAADRPPARGAAETTQTYVRRRGRMTRGQARALEQLADRFVVPLEALSPQPAAVFQDGDDARPLGLEIGFGMGQALIEWALERPDWRLIGAEIYQPGIGSALLGIEQHDLRNLRLVEAPAEDLLTRGLGSGSLTEVRIFFPDPWPKTRHHKRRLVQPELAALVADRLAPDGLLWVATDWEPYAEWIIEVLDAEPALLRERAPRIDDDASVADNERPRTRFEARGLRLGHRVWDLRYRRKR